MARRINDELVLDHDEASNFSFMMSHPDSDAIAARDLFLHELDNIQLSFNKGEIIAVLPDITITSIDSLPYQCFLEEQDDDRE